MVYEDQEWTLENKCRSCKRPLIQPARNVHRFLGQFISTLDLAGAEDSLDMMTFGNRLLKAGQERQLEALLSAAATEVPLTDLAEAIDEELQEYSSADDVPAFLRSCADHITRELESEAPRSPILLTLQGLKTEAERGEQMHLKLVLYNTLQRPLRNVEISVEAKGQCVTFDGEDQISEELTLIARRNQGEAELFAKFDSSGTYRLDIRIHVPQKLTLKNFQPPMNFLARTEVVVSESEGGITQINNVTLTGNRSSLYRDCFTINVNEMNDETSDGTDVVLLPLEVDLPRLARSVEGPNKGTAKDAPPPKAPESCHRSGHFLVDGPAGKRLVFVFLGHELRVGRAADNHIVTRFDGAFGAVKGNNKWKAVSRHHARLVWDDPEVTLLDRRSMYGTRVLRDDDEVVRDLNDEQREENLQDAMRIQLPAEQAWQHPYTLNLARYHDLAGSCLCLVLVPDSTSHPTFSVQGSYHYIWLPDPGCEALVGNSEELPVSLPEDDLKHSRSFRIERRKDKLFVVPCAGVELYTTARHSKTGKKRTVTFGPNTSLELRQKTKFWIGKTSFEFREHQRPGQKTPRLGAEYARRRGRGAKDSFEVPPGFEEILLPLCSRLKKSDKAKESN